VPEESVSPSRRSLVGTMTAAVARVLSRFALGLVLLVAGLLKGADPVEFIRQITTYGIVSGNAAAVLAYLLIPVEVALGVALIVGFRARLSAAAGSLLMLGFMVATAYAWSRGKGEGCGCFGSLVSRAPGEVLLEDTGFLALGVMAFFLARKGERDLLGRGIVVAGSLIGAVLLSFTAYALPLDPWVTDLRIGRSVEDFPLRESPVDLATGDHLVALLDLDSPDAGAVVERLNRYSKAPGAPAVIAFYGGEVDEKVVFCFNYGPGFEVVPAIRADLKRLFRTLPRFFRVRDGKVARIWDGAPPDAEELR